jgi:NitT/TauT family transport system substrate-binding protein
MKRIDFARTAGAAAVAAASAPNRVWAADLKSILIAEPAHSLGYLPLYVAIEKGFLTGLDVSTITLPSSGSEHTNAVLTGRAWGFIGGPEHNAYADVKGAQLRAICNVVNKGNVYFVAVKGVSPGKDLKAFFKGKRIAVSGYGGTPNSILRYTLKKYGLDPQKDVTLLEVATPAVPAVLAQGKADIGVMDEPNVTKGVEAGVWQQPFYAAPKDLGPYAYSTVNVTQQSINADPGAVRAFVVGMKKALLLVRDHKDEAIAVAAKTFPDLTPSVLRSAFDRAYNDQIWEWDGKITAASWKTAQSVVIAAGLLASEVPYAEVIDTQFFDPTAKGK